MRMSVLELPLTSMPWDTPYSYYCCNSNLLFCSKLNFVFDDLLNTGTVSFESRIGLPSLSPDM